MPQTLRERAAPKYRLLFPDWSGPRPLDYFLMENLLEARRQSEYPTNICGPDEDVNVYLVHLLTTFLTGQTGDRVVGGASPLLQPPDKLTGRRSRADFYRHNGDQRLIFQGLFHRGDGCRRNSLLYGWSREESWERDLNAGRYCYEVAANLLQHRQRATSGLAPVLTKLARNYERYVHVLAAVATRRLGLGARLSSQDLSQLLVGAETKRKAPQKEKPAAVNMDDLLDAIAAHRRDPSPEHRNMMMARAAALGVDSTSLPAV